MTAAIRQVSGSTDADVELARTIRQDGEAGSWRAAIELAMFRRQSQPKRNANDDAHRKRRAVAADAAAKGGDPNGRPIQRFPQTPEEERAFMERDAQAGILIK